MPETVIRGWGGQAAVAVTLDFGANNPAMRQANAAFIVRAVNSHEQLVAALKETLATVNGWLDDSRGYPPEDILASDGAWHKRALEALAAAGEQP